MKTEERITVAKTKVDFGEFKIVRLIPESHWPLSFMVTQTTFIDGKETKKTVVVPLTDRDAVALADDLIFMSER